MSVYQSIEAIEQAALQLGPGARAKLAHSLVGSLSDISREQLEALWLDEAERRDAEMDSGAVQGIPGDEVFAAIEAKLRS